MKWNWNKEGVVGRATENSGGSGKTKCITTINKLVQEIFWFSLGLR